VDTKKAIDENFMRPNLENSKKKIASLKKNFSSRYENVQKIQIQLKNIYQTKFLLANYYKFIQNQASLSKMMQKKYDPVNASEFILKALELSEKNDFTGLKFYESKLASLKETHRQIVDDCETRMTKALEGFNFYEVKTIISALNNLQMLPVKLQEITNNYLKENFGTLRVCFTAGTEGFSGYENFCEFWSALEAFLASFEGGLEVILKNSKKIWTIECCSIEKSSDLYCTKINE
jgi:hypothetical protein